MGAFKEPHGGRLIELYLSEAAAEQEKTIANDYVSWDLGEHQLSDLELLLNGGFSPLEGYNSEEQYLAVLDTMRLPDGVLWPLPVVLDVSEAFAATIKTGQNIALRDPEGVLIATMRVDSLWRPDKGYEATKLYGSDDEDYFGVQRLVHDTRPVYLGGPVRGVEPPVHYDFKLLRDSPSELRGRFRKLGWRRVVAYQPRAVMHRAEQELGAAAARVSEANLLVHPSVGPQVVGEPDRFTRVRCLEHVVGTYPELTTALSILNHASRFAGPREVLWQAIIRKNFGCTHFVVQPGQADYAYARGEAPKFDPDACRALYREHESELDITMVPLDDMVYVEQRAQFMAIGELPADAHVLDLDERELRRRLEVGLDVPEWFSYPTVLDELRRAYPSRNKQGFTVFFTGLSGSGKSTVANALVVKLRELGGRSVTLLDGDIVRKHLSSELGFSKEHRNLNILRTGFVASEITKHGGVAICAPIAPYAQTRRRVREMVEREGGFVEVYVATPLEVCEQRDRKGLYARARAGIVKEFTGISDPYESPENPELLIDTSELTPELAAHRIIIKLEALGYVK